MKRFDNPPPPLPPKKKSIDCFCPCLVGFSITLLISCVWSCDNLEPDCYLVCCSFDYQDRIQGSHRGYCCCFRLELLRRGSTYDQLVTAITTCVLPAGAKLVQITEWSVNLKVQAEHKNGTLKEGLEIAGGEQVELIVTIDEQEYNKARKELSMEAQRGD